MNPILKENVLKAAINRRELELEMIKMREEMKGEKLISLIKEDWLKSITIENMHVDKLMEVRKGG